MNQRPSFVVTASLLFASACASAPPPHVDNCEHHHGPEEAAARGEAESAVGTDKAVVIPHDGLRAFENNGNELIGIATPSLGGGRIEVWRSSVQPGKKTPEHTHSSEEVFIVLRGSGRVRIGQESYEFRAPCTVIAPANVPHQVENTGTEPTDQIVIVEAGSKIEDADGREMRLPWRK